MPNDHGTLGEEEKLPDKGVAPIVDSEQRNRPQAQFTPSHDLFGNEIKPAAPDRVPGGDKGYVPGGDKGAPPVVATNSESPTKTQKSEKTQKSATNPAVIIGGACAAAVALGILFWTASKLTTGTGFPGVGAMSPNEIFTSTSPSIVTLKIATKAYALHLKTGELISATTDDPVLIIQDDDKNMRLYQDGKSVAAVTAYLKLPQGKLPVEVRLSGSTPILYPLKNGKPMTGNNGQPIRLHVPSELESYTQMALGSGFFVCPDVVATNWHVVSNPDIGAAGFAGGIAQITDKAAKYTITDKPIAFDKDHDLALLFVPGTGAKPMKMHSDYGSLKVGQAVYALGSPKGLAGSISEGLISSDKLRGRQPADPDSPKLYIQHSAKIDHGNSGGPLVDVHGDVIGINTAGLGNGAINLAVTTRFVEDLLNKSEVKARIEELSKQNNSDLHG